MNKTNPYLDKNLLNNINVEISKDNSNVYKEIIIKQGYLMKESSFIGSLRKRWMVLKLNKLYSFKNDSNIHFTNATEIFDLNEYTECTNVDDKKFYIKSIKTNKKRVFLCDNYKDKNEWIRLLNNPSNIISKSNKISRNIKPKNIKSYKSSIDTNKSLTIKSKNNTIENKRNDGIKLDKDMDSNDNGSEYKPSLNSGILGSYIYNNYRPSVSNGIFGSYLCNNWNSEYEYKPSYTSGVFGSYICKNIESDTDTKHDNNGKTYMNETIELKKKVKYKTVPDVKNGLLFPDEFVNSVRFVKKVTDRFKKTPEKTFEYLKIFMMLDPTNKHDVKGLLPKIKKIFENNDDLYQEFKRIVGVNINDKVYEKSKDIKRSEYENNNDGKLKIFEAKDVIIGEDYTKLKNTYLAEQSKNKSNENDSSDDDVKQDVKGEVSKGIPA